MRIIKPTGNVIKSNRKPNPDNYQEGDVWQPRPITRWTLLKWRVYKLFGREIPSVELPHLLVEGEWIEPAFSKMVTGKGKIV